METLKEILRILISWPTAIIAICVTVIILRNSISRLIKRLVTSEKGKAKVGPVEIDFGKSTDDTQKDMQMSEEHEPEKREETESPLPEKDTTELLNKLLDLLLEGDYKEAQKFFNQEVKSTLDSDEKLLWYAYVMRRSHELGDSEAFSMLKETVNQNKTNPEVIKHLAYRYKEMGEFKKARENFLLAKEQYDIKDEHQRSQIVNCHVQVAWCLALDDKYEQAIDTLKHALDEHESPQLQATILGAMAYIAKHNSLTEDFIFYAEASLNLEQLNETLRFDLAHTYSAADCHKLSLLHYRKLEKIRSQPVTLNNLGVCYNRLKLKAKSIRSYHKSAKHKNTLAMSNLAYAYLDAGFLNDAKEVIDEANKLSAQGVELSARVGSALQKLENIQSEENEEEKKLLEGAEKEREFRLRYSQTKLRDKPINEKNWLGPWETPWGEAKIEIDEDSNSFKIKLHTKEEDKFASALLPSIGLSFGLLQPEKVYKERNIVIDGIISGLTGRYTINIDDAKKRASLLTAGELYRATGYMVINESCDRIEIMEKIADDNTDFKEWKKVGRKITQKN